MTPLNQQDLNKASEIILAGGLVAFPTETVYGLGADATNPVAVSKIFEVKGRPVNHPLIVHLASVDQINAWAIDVPDAAWILAEQIWPGPLTMILKRHPSVRDEVTGGQETVGLRIPGHPLALALLNKIGIGLAAPSANRFGRISPTRAEHVRLDLGSSVDFILDGGACKVGLESTIIDLSRGQPVLLRPGTLSISVIQNVLSRAVQLPDGKVQRVSGALESHYAPIKPLLCFPSDQIVERTNELHLQGKKVSVMSDSRLKPDIKSVSLWINAPQNADSYAQLLYSNLRALEQSDCDFIVVQEVLKTGDWLAISDRLTKAAHG